MSATLVVTAIASLIAELTASGLTIHQVMQQVQATGIVPPEEWAKLKTDFDDAEKFWDNGG